MSRNLETVKSIYAAFGRGDIGVILEALADDVHWEAWADNSAARAGVPWLQPRRGKAGAAEFFGLIGSTLVVTDFRVLALMDGGSTIAAELEMAGNVPATGSHFKDEEVHLWTFDDNGTVVRFRHYADTAKHIRAAGLHTEQRD